MRVPVPFILLASFALFGSAPVLAFHSDDPGSHPTSIASYPEALGYTPLGSEELARDNHQRAEWFRSHLPYLTNHLIDPRFHVPGSEVTASDVQNAIGLFSSTFKEAMGWKTAFLAAGAETFTGRLKTVDSLLGKMHGRDRNGFTLDAINDIVGVRAIVPNLAEEQKLVDFIFHHFYVHVFLDYVKRDLKPDGYRAEHFTVESKDGKLVEIQIQTENQNRFANFTHDRIYKGNPGLEKDPEVQAYLRELSDALWQRDQGSASYPLPQPPSKLARLGITFQE